MMYGSVLIRVLVVGVMLGFCGQASASLLPDAPSSWFRLNPVYSSFEDAAGTLELPQALEQSARWQREKKSAVNKYYTRQPLWLRFDVDVQTASALATRFELGTPYLDRIDFYLVQWQQDQPVVLDHRQAGDHLDFSQRFLQHRHPLFEALFPQAGRYSLLLRIRSDSAMMFPFTLQYPDQFHQAEIRSQVFYGLFFGTMLTLAYFNLMLLIYVREKTFLHNFLFIASMAAYQASLSGFGYNYLWFGNTAINDHGLIVAATLSLYFGGRFALRFMELELRAPQFYRVGHILTTSFLVLLPLALLVPERYLIPPLQVFGIVTAGYALFVMIHQALHGNDWARYLLLGWSATIAGYCVFIMAMLDLFEFSTAVLYLQAAGLGVGNVLVTTAIAARVRRERREKALAMHQALQLSQEVAQLTREKEQLQHSASLHLEQQVEEKTQALNLMLENLQKSNRRLQKDSLSDALTGLGNRRFLDTVFSETVQQCIRHRSPLGILVIDADHFKKINDTYGHLAGDECLRKIATVLQKYCRRNLDTLVRYGGEEFVMLLPATDLEGVMKVAESIRHHVQYAQFWFDDKRVPVTVSLGAHVGIPPLHATPDNLMHKADEALYLAKRNGRNRVEVYKARYETVKA